MMLPRIHVTKRMCFLNALCTLLRRVELIFECISYLFPFSIVYVAKSCTFVGLYLLRVATEGLKFL